MHLARPSPILVADRFPALLDALLELLSSLSEEDWTRPTALAGWSVKDVAQHLLGDEIGILSGKRDQYREPPTPLQGWDALVAFINQRNLLWIQATRRISPQLLRQLLRHTGDQVNAFYQGLDPFQMGGAVSWVGPQPAPVWLDIAREFTERWHHQQHIRDAVGKPGAAQPDFLAPVLAAFAHALPRTYASVPAPEGTTITLIISGPAGSEWTVAREQAGWQLYAGKPDTPDAQIEMDQDAAWRLFTRGINPAQVRGRSRLTGDAALAERALETISIIA